MVCVRGMKMTDVNVRRAEEADIPAVARVVNTWIDKTGWMPRVFSRDDIEGFVRDAFPDRSIWVVGEPVEAYVSFDPETAKIGALYCDRGGNGIGKALLDKAREGQDQVWLATHEPNVRAQKFYLREGFEEVARYDPDPPETVREIRMEWNA